MKLRHGAVPLALALLPVAAGWTAAPANAATGSSTRGAPALLRLPGPLSTIADAGDINGDGSEDLIVGGGGAGPCGDVILGSAGLRRIRLRPSSPGVLSFGCGPRAANGAVAGLGDANGDGYADVAALAEGVDSRHRRRAGSVYVVHGRPDLRDLDLRALGNGGVRIDGPGAGTYLGGPIMPVGDVNGDGRPDAAVVIYHRSSYRFDVAVVFGGRPGGTVVDLAHPGAGALILTGFPASLSVGDDPPSIAGGDINGDGLSDVLVGGTVGRPVLGFAGRPQPGRIDVSKVSPLLRVGGLHGGDSQVAFLNEGDRGSEIAVSAVGVDGPVAQGPVASGVAVVPAQPGRLRFDHLPAAAWMITDSRLGRFGASVTAVGDLTGDGRDDLLVSDPTAAPGCRPFAGAVWLVPGGTSEGTMRPDAVPGAKRIDGWDLRQGLGQQVVVANLNANGTGQVLAADAPGYRRPDVFAAGPLDQPLPPLGTGRCLGLLSARGRGRLRLRVRSDLGVGQAHTVRATVRIVDASHHPTHREIVFGLSTNRAVRTTARFPGPGRKTLVLRMRKPIPRRAYLSVELHQRAGPGFRGEGFGVRKNLRRGGVPQL